MKLNYVFFYIFITSISSNKILQVRFVQVWRNLRIFKHKGISDIVAYTVDSALECRASSLANGSVSQQITDLSIRASRIGLRPMILKLHFQSLLMRIKLP